MDGATLTDQPLTGRAKSLANLRPPIGDSERARELGRRSGEARRAKRAKAEAKALADLVPLALRRQKELLEGDEKAYWQRAIDAVYDRVEGKPTQRTEVEHSAPAQQFTREQLLEELRKRSAGELRPSGTEPS